MKDTIQVKLSEHQLSTPNCLQFVEEDGAGGIVTFVGTIRNNTQGRAVKYLDFEAYEPMAVSEMKKIGETIQKRWKTIKIAIHHRIGRLEIGDIAVIIAVATPHRKAAFEACEFAIDTLKKTVPIWKKEVFEDGEVWVSAHP